ncbi:MAG: AMP-binding protein [Kouleothrix sp.]
MTRVSGGTNMTDYEAERRDFKLVAPADFNWAYDVIDRWAADPQHQAMFWVGSDGTERPITFADFSRRSNQLANALAGLGVGHGDRVFLMPPRLVEWWSIRDHEGWRCVDARHHLLTPKDIAYRANLAETRVVITDTLGAASSMKCATSARPEDLDRCRR